MESPESLGEKALALVGQEIVIKDNEDLEKVNDKWNILNALKKEIKAGYDDIINATYKAWKIALAKKAYYIDPVEKEMALLRSRKAEYIQIKAREREEEEARLFIAEVKKAEESREDEDEPITVAPVVLPDDVPSGGPVLQTRWGYEIVDFDELIKAVAEGRYPSIALLPNEKHLRQQATSFKEHLNIPGVRSFKKVV